MSDRTDHRYHHLWDDAIRGSLKGQTMDATIYSLATGTTVATGRVHTDLSVWLIFILLGFSSNHAADQ